MTRNPADMRLRWLVDRLQAFGAKSALTGASPSIRRLSAVAAALIVVGLLIGGLAICQLRADAAEAARHDAQRLGVVIAEQTTRSIQAADLVLQELREKAMAAGVATPEGLRRLLGTRDFHQLLAGDLTNLSQVDAIVVADADGKLINTSRSWPGPALDASDRDYFSYLKAHDDRGVFVTGPLRNRNTGTPAIYLVRRVNGPKGEFLGIMLAVIRLSYFANFYGAIGLTDGGGVTLLRRDGVVLVRFPHPERLPFARMPQASPWHGVVRQGGGSYHTSGTRGSETLFVSVHPLSGYPLVIDATISEDVAYAAWRRQVAVVALGALCGVLCILLLARALVGQFRGLEAARAALAEKSNTLATTLERLETTLEHIDQGLFMVDADGVIAVCNQNAIEMLQWSRDVVDAHPTYAEMLAYEWRIQEFALDSDAVKDIMLHDDLRDHPLLFERCRPDGSRLEVHSVPVAGGGFVRTFTDITERRAAEEKARYLARHDELTGLANRSMLHAHVSRELTRRRNGGGFAVLYLDLDQFKDINDTLGHPVGDALLCRVAERLRGCIRNDDLVARLGGDEFAIVQGGIADATEAKGLAERMMEMFTPPFELDGRQFLIGASLGIAIGPDDGADADTLLKNADMALFRAKADGRATYRFFEPIMDAEIQERRALEFDLREALANGEFELFFQPMLHTRSLVLSGFEALIRWRHPSRGLVAPDHFIPLCEEIGLIVPVGEWVLREACRQAAAWPDDLDIAVNLSAVQFRSSNLVAAVAEALTSSGLPAARLELEITESVLLQNTAATLETLHGLRRLGPRVALDDFGTGYSSLSYLRLFPFDKIKIDRTFVRELRPGAESLAIVRATLELGHVLGMSVTAEGVETEEQLVLLQAERCAHVQGHLFSEPRPAADIPALIERFAAMIRSAA